MPRPRRASCAAALVAAVGALTAVGLVGPSGAVAVAPDNPRETVVQVQPDKPGPPISARLTGVNNDQWFELSHGLWDYPDPSDPRGKPDPRVVAKTAAVGAGVVRYPGGTPANLFDWKRAIGPTESRGCQTDARPGDGEPRDSIYGPDEHMRFVAQAGAEAEIKATFANQTAADAADWVEYMNAPSGTNPNGGTAWAQQRAANGHPAPYGVRFWEVGNEHDRPDQRYWMSADPQTALRQYTLGGTQRQDDQLLGKGCDFSPDVASDGSAGQDFAVLYPPVTGPAQVRVATEVWREVADLSTAGPDDPVYTLDRRTGRVGFGDGTHGRIPPAGQQVFGSYDSGPHDGFVDFYAAMKATDPTADVCATWAPITADTGLGQPGLPELMRSTGHADDYDCLVVHPYTNFTRQFDDTFDTALQGHDEHMLGEAEAARIFRTHVDAVRRNAPADTYVTVSEFGALFFGPNNTQAYRSWNTAMSHATYMASQWTRFAQAGVPWAEGNTLVSETPSGLRGVLSGEPSYVLTSEAVVRQALAPVVQGGGTVVGNRVVNNPLQPTEPTALGSSYPALLTTATVDRQGRLHVVVVNRQPYDAVTARVVTGDFAHASTAAVSSVVGANSDPNREGFESHNSLTHPDEVSLSSTNEQVGPGSFRHTFPAHSVTVLTLAAAG